MDVSERRRVKEKLQELITACAAAEYLELPVKTFKCNHHCFICIQKKKFLHITLALILGHTVTL